MTPTNTDAPDYEERLGGVICACLDALEAGQAPDHVLSSHPEFKHELQEFLAGRDRLQRLAAPLRRIAQVALAGQAPALPATSFVAEQGWLGESGEVGELGALGDFRLLREIGRGGMGIVYEAEQLSLRRKVALKVLPFASTLDERHLQRFKNEAQAAACLHHTHIVPVYAVGSDRGVHYYAMQYIAGRSLAEVLVTQRGPAPGAHPVLGGQVETAAAGHDPTTARTEPKADSRQPLADARTVARWGQEAAEALEYAHDQGVLHRDIKPANLLVDGRGHIWITDFGLAHISTDTHLTPTGDVLGTLRYMSPGQARGNRAGVDQRTDIYSLGATLYELLTLRPAFAGDDRQDVFRRILNEEPTPPRQLNPAIPADLETIVLKCLAKEPAERYATAQALADDLDAFLRDRHIKARRPTVWQRGRKWGKRHRTALQAVAAAVLVSLLFGALALWQERGKTLQALASADQHREEAEARARTLRRRLYVADMGRAHQLWQMGLMEELAAVLSIYEPAPLFEDLRGFEWHLLRGFVATSPRNVANLQGHKANVYAVAYSPDGSLIATGGDDW